MSRNSDGHGDKGTRGHGDASDQTSGSPCHHVAPSPRHIGERTHALKIAAIAGSFPLFLAIARFVPWHRLPSPCVFYRITGLPCPSCGMTRSAVALTHLDFRLAWQLNPLGVLFVGLFGAWWACAVYEVFTGRKTRLLAWATRRANAFAVIGLIVLFVYGIARILAIVHPF